MSAPLSDEEMAQLRALLEEDDRDLGTRHRRELLQLLRRDHAWRVQLETHQDQELHELRVELGRLHHENAQLRGELHVALRLEGLHQLQLQKVELERNALLQAAAPDSQHLVGRLQGLEAQVVRLAGRVELALEAIGELAAQVDERPELRAYVPRAEDDLL